jgi:hypothetical protein
MPVGDDVDDYTAPNADDMPVGDEVDDYPAPHIDDMPVGDVINDHPAPHIDDMPVGDEVDDHTAPNIDDMPVGETAPSAKLDFWSYESVANEEQKQPAVSSGSSPPLPLPTEPSSQQTPDKPRQKVWLYGLLVLLFLLIIGGIFGYQQLVGNHAQQPTTNTVLATPMPTAMPAAHTGKGDLQVEIVGIFPEEPKVGDVVNIKIQLANTGSVDITEPFWVDLYVSSSRTPTVNLPWNEIAPYGATWLVRQLKADEKLVLESLGADAARSNLLRFSTPEIHTLQVLADSYGLDGTGAIVEQNEDNNLSEMGEITIAPGNMQR